MGVTYLQFLFKLKYITVHPLADLSRESHVGYKCSDDHIIF